MPATEAAHLLNPIRSLILSPGRLVKRLGLRPDSQVLEIGPGPGYYSVAVAKAVPRGRLTLVDIQPEMLAMAKERVQRAGLTNVEFLQGDAVSLPLTAGSVDVVFLVAVLGEVPAQADALSEIRRVLRPGGMLSLTERMTFVPHSLPSPDVIRMATAAGFEHTTSHEGPLRSTLDFRA